jgi:NTP-dependent ternary system trypsin peptidase co-occuring protein
MGKLVKLETERGTILIESSISQNTGTVQQAGGISEIKKKLGDLLDVITPISESIISSVDKLSKKPDSITAEYGLSITAEGNLFVVKAAGEASLKVTFAWSPGNKEKREKEQDKQERMTK